jgi:hypothetical protein
MAMGQAAFAAVLWGAILGVFLVFCYEVYVVGRDAGWVG